MKISLYLGCDSKTVLTKLHENPSRINREIGEKHALQVNVTLDKATWHGLQYIRHIKVNYGRWLAI